MVGGIVVAVSRTLTLNVEHKSADPWEDYHCFNKLRSKEPGRKFTSGPSGDLRRITGNGNTERRDSSR